ncbi:serine hydrolase domain-containing protein [Pseudoduganella namucuonensis]|uniref:CubicO group peptidase, beta-lactamase class C family n=1 Tax=Pseudoduganella namucuonensis TaxID=1035707 RepID=A0A1I7M751_9BURK|nr:serine hydrolase domain-containing protein [Pseudoduganella namucuonensis]SFV17774.1 CubicO group peptidase, beta-lactamase class C family [Pseudoduganella namucuonensis]
MGSGMRAALGWLLAGGGGAPVMPASAAGPSAIAALDRELAAVVEDGRRPLSGLSVLAIRDGKVVYERQFGLRRVATAEPVTAATLFRIASISKMATTLGLMRLVEEGRLDLDADAGPHLGFPLRNPHFPQRAVTLRHLLTHTSSLRDDAGYFWGADTRLADVFAPGGAMWASGAGPGGYFSYSNLNWGVIGTLMERVTGERFDRLMKRLLLAPLGLRGGYNTAEFTAEEVANTATLYRKRGTDTETWDPSGPWIAQADDFGAKPPAAPPGLARYAVGGNGTLFSPTGGLRISAADLGGIMLMLMNKGEHEGKRILKPETIALMFSEQWTHKEGNGDTLRGLYHGWGLGAQRFIDTPGRGNRLVQGGGFGAAGHLGEAYGLVSTFAVDLDRRNGLVSLIGGLGTDPELYPGQYSALVRSEELILTALYRRAVLGRAD